MKRELLITNLLLTACVGLVLPAYSQNVSEERLKSHVYTLASDSLMGRKAGSVFSKKAAEYIANQWTEIGISPLEGESFFVHFNHTDGKSDGGNYINIAGIIEGNDPELKDEYIVVGAHYDHLGFNIVDGNTTIFYGADDNASGVAAIIEMGRRLKEIQPALKRSVILVAFDGEELGLYGSTDFVNKPMLPVDRIKLMLSVDMVGWYKKSGYVKYIGVGTIKNGKLLLSNKQLIPDGLNVLTQKFERSILTATDTEPFAKKGIPTLDVTTGLKSPYHKPEDEAKLIDFDGLAMITEHLANTVQAVSQEENFQASGKQAPKHKNKKFFMIASIGSGNNYHYYTAGALDGKPSVMANAGITANLDMNLFALRPEVYYDYIEGQHPLGTVRTHSVTVPLNFVMQTPHSMSVGAGFLIGPYYNYKFSGRQGSSYVDFGHRFNRGEFGLNYGVFLRLAQINLGFTYRTGLTNFSRYKDDSGAYIMNHTSFVSLGYEF